MSETETAEAHANGKAPGGKHKAYVIFIDREQFKVESDVMTGAELRALPTPPIGQDRDLWEEIPGHGDDRKINDTGAGEGRADRRPSARPAASSRREQEPPQFRSNVRRGAKTRPA